MLTDVNRDTTHDTYPTSDGEPMAETDVHRDQIIQLITTLEAYFASRPDVYVTGNLLMFYQEGDGRKHISPDVMVVLGVAKHRRDHYKIWEEGKAPDVVIEVTSASTRNEDMGSKKGLYALHGVCEYFVFDPLREYLPAGLKGFQLAGEEYMPMVGTTQVSQVLGLELTIVDSILRLRDPRTDSLLPVHTELVAELAGALARADAERTRADMERARADMERARAAAEKERADGLAKELETAREQLQRRGRDEDPS